MNSNIEIVSYTNEKVSDLIPKIAELRIEVFAEYPFLYAGDYEYEMRYLKKFLSMKEAIVVLARDKEHLIGISNGYPFSYEAENLTQVFISLLRNPKDYFCIGESILKKSYRGLGIGKKFYGKIEEHARKLNYKYICFYTSLRPIDDPRRPADYQPLGLFWQKLGYVEHPELIGTISYQEIGEKEETPKEMIFWIKELK